MTKANTYSILFHLRNEKRNKMGQAPIYMRVTIKGQRVEISTKQWIEPSRWNQSSFSVKGYKNDAQTINKVIEYYRIRAWNTYIHLEEKYIYVTAAMVKSRLTKQSIERKTLVDVYTEHNQMVKERIDIDYAEATHDRHKTTLKHIKDFLKKEFKRDDIDLIEIKYSFIEKFEHYLKTKEKPCAHNTTLKYINMFRKIIISAVKNDWLIKDPFAGYDEKFEETSRGFLTNEELDRLVKKDISIERLGSIRDIFVFACYTGLAFTDVQKLTPDNLKKREDGEEWIITSRTKNGNESKIPLLPIPKKIIDKYKDSPISESKGKLLPVISNQKTNAYLKELADICGIEKKLTFHIARHTFATSVTLTNDVPIESVSKMLGHKSIRTTQIYAKIVDQKVKNDMLNLKNKLDEKSNQNNEEES